MTTKRKQSIILKRDETLAWNPYSWEATAYGLVCSANVLFQFYESKRKSASDSSRAESTLFGLYPEILFNVVLMLYGAAIENLVKGILISKNFPDRIEPFLNNQSGKDGNTISENEFDYAFLMDTNRRLNKVLLTHDLNCLFARAKISRTPEDKQLLDLLEDAITSGKYPIAQDAKIRSSAFPYLDGRTPVSIRQHILALLKKVDDNLRTINRHPLSSDNVPDLTSLCMDG